MDGTKKRRVLVTGAAAKIGRLIAGPLGMRYDLTLTDIQPGFTGAGTTIHFADVTDVPKLQSLCTGVDTVLHLAVQNYKSEWDAVLTGNIVGVYNILKAAADARCRRVIFPSSIQVMDGYPGGLFLKPEMPVRPLNLYAASKVWGEAVGHVFARTTDLSVLCLRIGWVVPHHSNNLNPRQPNLDQVITDRDLVSLIESSIEAPDDLKFGIFHGLSDNKIKRLDIAGTERGLGFKPQDDAFELADRNRLWRLRSWADSARRWIGRLGTG